jgi:hypothetical protein
MALFDDTEPVRHVAKTWQGVFSRDVADLTNLAYVTIPDMDPHLEIGPCRWQSRDQVSLPVKGDVCLVIFDNDNAPWIAVWWPF